MKLEDIRDKIENMEVYHHKEILKILNADPEIIINENSNGSFINLNDITSQVKQNLETYINYVDQQMQNLEILESKKTNLEETFFSTGTEDI